MKKVDVVFVVCLFFAGPVCCMSDNRCKLSRAANLCAPNYPP
jgi:hypothetical protein